MMDPSFNDQLAADAHAHPDVWYRGYDASMNNRPASTCPYGPENTRLMNVWLSGHVTAAEERNDPDFAA